MKLRKKTMPLEEHFKFHTQAVIVIWRLCEFVRLGWTVAAVI